MLCEKHNCEKREILLKNSKIQRRCLECDREYYIANKEKIKKRAALHYKKNKVKIDLINKNNRKERGHDKKYRERHREEIKVRLKSFYEENKEKYSEYAKEKYLADRDKIKERVKIYSKNNKEKLRKYHTKYKRDRRKTNPEFKIRMKISSLICCKLKKYNGHKDSSFTKYLKFSINELKIHLEKQFEPWMSWENWGKYNSKIWNDDDKSTWTWNIDHIVPQSKLPYDSMSHPNFQKCWALQNLRPYSAKQNIIDGDRR